MNGYNIPLMNPLINTVLFVIFPIQVLFCFTTQFVHYSIERISHGVTASCLYFTYLPHHAKLQVLPSLFYQIAPTERNNRSIYMYMALVKNLTICVTDFCISKLCRKKAFQRYQTHKGAIRESFKKPHFLIVNVIENLIQHYFPLILMAAFICTCI